MQNIFTITGGSGTGKTTLARKIREACPEYNIIKSFTTRPLRENELNNKDLDHTFIHDCEFDLLDDKIAESPFGNKYRYCATKHQLTGNDIYIIDDYGLMQLERHDFNLIKIKLKTDESVLEKRNINKERQNRDSKKFFFHDDSYYDIVIHVFENFEKKIVVNNKKHEQIALLLKTIL